MIQILKIRIPLIILAAFSLVFAGCSKHSQTSAAQQKSDLGVVEFSDGIESKHDIGGGRDCIITPAIHKDGTILLTIKIEQSGKELGSPRVQTLPGTQVAVSIGNISVSLTPKIKQ